VKNEKMAGREESLRFFSDSILIDKMRHGVNTGDSMTQKRTLHQLREVGKARLRDYWAELFDELFFVYLSGARGVNDDFITGTDVSTDPTYSINAVSAPDAGHILYGGDANGKASIGTNDGITLALIEKAQSKAAMMTGIDRNGAKIQPIPVGGRPKHVCVMSPWQRYALKTASGTNTWLDIQKALTSAVGENSPIFTGAIGDYSGTVLHEHSSVIRFTDYGGGTEPAARALFVGAQAGAIAFGMKGSGLRFDWHEEMDDRGEEPVIVTKTIVGIKASTFNSQRYGLLALDTYAVSPY
jgi:N4-gp56 family major capsid protein